MITSKSNELIKLCLEIKEKKGSRKHNLCFVETFKIIKQLYQKNLLTHILVSDNKDIDLSCFEGVSITKISNNIANYLSDAVTTDGIFAICKIPNNQESNYIRCLILDRIQDPSNLGAIIRSACAFGYSTILSLNSVYPYSFKVIRSSMGYVFDINFVEVDYEELKKLKNENNIKFISADMNVIEISQVSISEENTAIIIGNEGQGVNEELIKFSDLCVSIPMKNNVESLNASVSAGILMYILK